ncbi:MAG: hypothetical protein ACLRP3_09435 [Escherichia sp.]
MGEFMPMMLIDFSQNTLCAMLFQLRQRIELNKLAQLLRHPSAFDDKILINPVRFASFNASSNTLGVTLRPACQYSWSAATGYG